MESYNGEVSWCVARLPSPSPSLSTDWLSALDNEETTNWSFCPSLPAAYLFVVLFGIVLCAHVAQAIIHRKGYSWVIIVSATLQFLAYVFRIRSINAPDNATVYILWFVFILVCILLAPATPGEEEAHHSRLLRYLPMPTYTWW